MIYEEESEEVERPRKQRPERKHIDLEHLGKILGAIVTSSTVLFGVYTSVMSQFKTLDDRISQLEKHSVQDDQMQKTITRIEDLEKQNIRDEKYRDLVKEEEADIKDIKRDMNSTSESLMELFRMIRRR